MKKFTFVMSCLTVMMSQALVMNAQEAVTPPQGIEPAIYVFTGHDTYINKEKTAEVFVVMDGDQVYIQGLSIDYLPGGWVKGTLADGTLTIPACYMGTFNFWGDEYALDFDGAEFAYDADANTFTAPDGYTTSVEGEVLDEYNNVTLTGTIAKAATPAMPEITEFTEDNYGRYIKMNIPLLDVDGNELFAAYMSYQLFYKVGNETHVFELTQDEYIFLDAESMTEIPYNYTDSYDVDKGGKQVYIYADDLDQWTAIGVKSIYRAGGEENESETFWLPLTSTGIDGIEATQVSDTRYIDLQGRMVGGNATGLLIKVDRLADGTIRTAKVVR